MLALQVMQDFGEVEKLGRFLHYYERFKNHGESLQVAIPAAHISPVSLPFSSASWSNPFLVQHGIKWPLLLHRLVLWRWPVVRVYMYMCMLVDVPTVSSLLLQQVVAPSLTCRLLRML